MPDPIIFNAGYVPGGGGGQRCGYYDVPWVPPTAPWQEPGAIFQLAEDKTLTGISINVIGLAPVSGLVLIAISEATSYDSSGVPIGGNLTSFYSYVETWSTSVDNVYSDVPHITLHAGQAYAITMTPITLNQDFVDWNGSGYAETVWGVAFLSGTGLWYHSQPGVGFTLYGTDAPVNIVELAFNQSIFTAPSSAVWTDISNDVMSIDTKRGRMHELDRIESGTATIIVDNVSGNYWRYNTSSAFYTSTSDAVKPMTLTRIRKTYNGTTYPLYYGYTESLIPDWVEDKGGKNPIMTLNCVDFFKTFTRTSLFATAFGGSATTTGTYPVQSTGARLDSMLSETSIPVAMQNIDVGLVAVTSNTPTTGGLNFMEHAQDVADAEQGTFFIGPQGWINFQQQDRRQTSPYASSSAIFNTSTDSLYVLPELSDDDTFIYNEGLIATATTGNLQVYYDSASIANQGERALVKNNTIIYLDTDAYDQAWMIVNRYKDSKLRALNLNIYPDANPDNLYPIVLGNDISKRITLNLNNADNPYALPNIQYHIEGIEHHWTAKENIWRTKWQLWDVNQYRSFTANHDGFVYQENTDYNTCHTAASGINTNDSGAVGVGQLNLGVGIINDYWEFRGFLSFDTSALTSTTKAAITSASMAVHCGTIKVEDMNWDLTVVDPQTVVSPVASTDYGVLLTSNANWGSVTISTPSIANTWLTIPLNSSAIASLAVGGTTKFAFRSSQDIIGNPPGTPGPLNDMVSFDGIGTSYIPKLYIKIG